ncbi:MAG: type II secretion system minor pseudopilin GspK [Candidatus Thiodiazotropha sp. (ex Ctena orbiculata)]|nr:type II secretion system minor pseudopilin GspK [Candidatus Thiodiazotropha sp. (ex Codakia orbicularis)]MBV2124487.1 type II secretion system minor pseudopilin GspK [Candidatus Thiodiazotropha taylori]
MPGIATHRSMHEKGVALITAIIVVSIASIAAVAMTHELQLNIRRSSNIFTADQGYLFTLGSEAWSRGMLIRDLNNNKQDGNYDGLDEDWAQELPPTPVEGGQVQAVTTDLQARFNLNNLYLKTDASDEDKQLVAENLALFRRLLMILELPESIAQATADWLDEDVKSLYPDGAEDMEYLNLDPPYRTANGAMASPTELRLIKGVDREVYEKLTPYIITLPEQTKINVNTADALIIQALVENLNDADAEQLISEREDDPFKQPSAFITRLKALLDENKVNSQKVTSLISVESQYFQMETVVRMESSSQRLVSQLYKGEKDVVVISRTLGAF